MRRRQFLASGTALLPVSLAGCAHPSVILEMDDATADDIADEASLLATSDSEEYEIVTSAAENGSTTRTGRYDRFDRTETVRVNESFYEVSETRLERSETTVYEVLIDFDPEDSTSDVGEIEYEDLPETDRRRLDPVVLEGDHPTQERYDVGVDYGSTEEVGNGSVFVPERQYDIIVHEGERYRVAVNSRTAPEAEYRYEVTEVASDVETFADRIRERYLFVLADISDAEREVVETAIEDGYYEESEAFRSVIDRIREHDGIEATNTYGTWLLEYDDLEYLAYAEW